jgi:hypothetical protein
MALSKRKIIFFLIAVVFFALLLFAVQFAGGNGYVAAAATVNDTQPTSVTISFRFSDHPEHQQFHFGNFRFRAPFDNAANSVNAVLNHVGGEGPTNKAGLIQIFRYLGGAPTGNALSESELLHLDVGEYIAVVNFSGTWEAQPINFSDQAKFEVVPRPINITLLGADVVRYNGNPHTRVFTPLTVTAGGFRYGAPQIKFSDINNLNSVCLPSCAQDCDIHIHGMNGFMHNLPLNVGQYQITFVFKPYLTDDQANDSAIVPNIDPNNFVIGNISFGATSVPHSEVFLTITPRPLRVFANDLNINFDKPQDFVWNFVGDGTVGSGFVDYAGESVQNGNESTIEELIELIGAHFASVPTEIGTYILTPTVNQLKNYTVTTGYTTFVINRVQLQVTSGQSRITVNGAFQPTTALRFTAVDKDSEIGHFAHGILLNRGDIRLNSDIEQIFDMTFTQGGRAPVTGEDNPSATFNVTITNVRVSPIFTHRVAVIDSHGNIFEINNFALRNNVLTFNSPADGHVIIYRDSLWTYITIGIIAGATAVLIAAGVVSTFLYKSLKKQKSKKQLQAEAEKEANKYSFD